MSNTDLPVQHIVYLGKCLLKGSKIGSALFFCTDEEAERGKLESGSLTIEDPRTHVYMIKDTRKWIRIEGGVYQIERNDNTIRAGSAKYIGGWPNESEFIEIVADAEQRERALLAGREEKKAQFDASFKKILDPIARLYRRSNPQLRAQLLAAVVQYIIAGGK